MPFYVTRITETAGRLDYAVPDIGLMRGVRYRWPTMECAFFYPDTLGELTELSEAEYRAFDRVDLATQDGTLAADGVDTETVTITYPVTGGEVILVVNGEEVDRQLVDANGQAEFLLSADPSLAGTMLKCELRHWDGKSQSGQWKPKVVYIEVV